MVRHGQAWSAGQVRLGRVAATCAVRVWSADFGLSVTGFRRVWSADFGLSVTRFREVSNGQGLRWAAMWSGVVRGPTFCQKWSGMVSERVF